MGKLTGTNWSHATGPVDDTKRPSEHPTSQQASPAAPEPVESIQEIVKAIYDAGHFNGRYSTPENVQHTDKLPFWEAALSRLLVQAKLEALDGLLLGMPVIEYSSWVRGEIIDRRAALQSQLEGAAGVANAGPSVPPEAVSGKGRRSA